MAKRLWKISVEHHAFLRLRQAEDAKKRSGFPRFGSKFRYSGRTLYQTRLNASMADRQGPKFDRTSSKQHLNASRQSINNNMRSRSHEYLPNANRDVFKDDPNVNIHNKSFDVETYRDRPPRIVQPPMTRVENYHPPPVDDRTPLQSPLPQPEESTLGRIIYTHTVREEEEEEIEDRLPEPPRDSPRVTRPQSNHGGVATPLAIVTLPPNLRKVENGDGSPRGSLDSEDLAEEVTKSKEKPKVKSKPAVKPKPPVAKKPPKGKEPVREVNL